MGVQGNFEYGEVDGTGAAINISLGWTPDYVKVINIEDAGGAAPSMEWVRGMTAGHGLKNTTDTQALVTSGGISPFAGTEAGLPAGFTIGTDSALNASGEKMVWIAQRRG